jgi:DNA-binding CsgD family transcriptional regulator
MLAKSLREGFPRSMVEESCTCPARRLTTRELDVAELLAQGLSTYTMADVLSLSHHTITAHLGKMLRRLNAQNRTELVARLYAYGILASGEWPPRADSRRNISMCRCRGRGRERPTAALHVGNVARP